MLIFREGRLNLCDYLDFRRSPSRTTLYLLWVLTASYTCVLILAMLKTSGVGENDLTDSRGGVPLYVRQRIDTAAAGACASQTLVLASKAVLVPVRRSPVVAAAMFCGLATLTYVLDAMNMLYRPYGLELGLVLLVISAGVMGFAQMGSLVSLHHGNEVAVKVLREGDVYGVCFWILLWPAMRYCLKLLPPSTSSIAVGATVCLFLLSGFALLAWKAFRRIQAVLHMHWLVLASGTAVYLLWCATELIHTLIAAGVPIPAGYALGGLAMVVVLQSLQLSLLVSHSTMTFEQAARLKAEQEATQAAIAMHIKEQQHAKRAEEDGQKFARYTRYVFHELRVPFNSIDLGLAMLYEDMVSAMQKGGKACNCTGEACCLRASSTHKSSAFTTLRLPFDFFPTLATILKASGNMKVIINDTLDLSKLKNGSFKVSLGGTDLRSLIEETVKGLSSMARHPDHDVRVNAIIDPRVPQHVLADAVRLQQVVGNLLSNAIKFAPNDGSGRVTIIVSVLADGLPEGELTEEQRDQLAKMPLLDLRKVSWKPQQGSSTEVDESASQSSKGSPVADVPPHRTSTTSIRTQAAQAQAQQTLPSTTARSPDSSVSFGVSQFCSSVPHPVRLPAQHVSRNDSPTHDVWVGRTDAGTGIAGTVASLRSDGGEGNSRSGDTLSDDERSDSHDLPSPVSDEASCTSRGRMDNVPYIESVHVTEQLRQTLCTEGFRMATSRYSRSSRDECAWTDNFARREHPSKPAAVNTNFAQNAFCNILTTVVDNGDGFPPADADLLFSAFRQLDAGKQYKGRGTGLGLVICREIVTLHGGRMGVQSSGLPGKGAQFHIALKLAVLEQTSRGLSRSCTRPSYEQGRVVSRSAGQLPSSVTGVSISVSDVHVPAATHGMSQPSGSPTGIHCPSKALTAAPHAGANQSVHLVGSSSAEEGTHQPCSIRILIVDDVADNRRLLRRALTRVLLSKLGPSAKVEADEAENGLVAVQLVSSNEPYDAIMMDAEMPVMSGFKATSTIRSMGYRGMIFGCTGNALDQDVALFRAQGADGIFIKPVDSKGLASAIMQGLVHRDTYD